jgi:hypothetical protein
MQDLNDKITGDNLTATEWNEVPSELQNVIEDTGQTLTSGDLNQLGKGISEYSTNGDFYTDSGVADAYVLSTTDSKQAPIAYRDGGRFRFRTSNTNTGASTVNIAGLGVKNIVDETGAALTGSEVSTTQDNEIVFDLGNDRFILKPFVAVELKSGRKNVIINGNFGVNQRGVSGNVILTAGEYGHDRFRGGSGGCTYTFNTSANITTLTISAGTLEQEVEGQNLFSGSYILSWSGTAQGQIDGGGFGASGLTTTLVGGTNAIIEFNTGTISLVQLEKGTFATNFEERTVGEEIALCQRYYQQGQISWFGFTTGGNVMYETWLLPVEMQTTPTLVLSGGVGIVGNGGSTTGLTDSSSFTKFVSPAGSDEHRVQFQDYTLDAEL